MEKQLKMTSDHVLFSGSIGKTYAYSDTNYILLGMLIEKLSQSAYYELLSTEILIPENLRHTYAAI